MDKLTVEQKVMLLLDHPRRFCPKEYMDWNAALLLAKMKSVQISIRHSPMLPGKFQEFIDKSPRPKHESKPTSPLPRTTPQPVHQESLRDSNDTPPPRRLLPEEQNPTEP